MRSLSKIARDRGIPLIVDEIQTGYCRTGRFLAFENFNIDPDLVTLGKAIANGLPLSAVVGRASIMDSMDKGGMGGTYGGNPIAASVALKVLEIFERDNICLRVRRLEEILSRRLQEFYERFDAIGDHRGLGVMRAIELVKDRRSREPDKEAAIKIIDEARRRGVILMKAGYFDNVVRFHPPLTIGFDVFEEALNIVEDVLKKTIS
jgi:4-aminobutyrate aminotransferase/(S)-3-amino-2-methylpropionate transaminase